MREYKISEFSKRMGVSIDLVKHYQSSGIIKPIVNKENGYRFFTIRHGERIMASRKYREMGFSVNDTKDILYVKNADEINEMLAKRKNQIELEIARLKLKSERMDEVQNEINEMIQNAGTLKMVEEPAYCFIKHIEKGEFLEDKETLEKLPKWIEHLDFSYKTFLGNEKNENINFIYGIMMEEKYYETFMGEDKENIIYYPSSKRLIYYLRTKYEVYQNVECFAIEQLAVAKKAGYTIQTDNILFQHIFDDYEDGVRYVNYKLHFFLK